MLNIKVLFTSILLAGFVSGCSLLSHEQTLSQKEEKTIPLKLYLYDCGHIEARDMSLFDGSVKKGTTQELANTCYLIEHPKGTLFWDAGIPDEVAEKPNGEDWFGDKFHMEVKNTLSSQFKNSNVNPKDIDYLVFSHLHNDHTGNTKLFTNATWIVQQAEYNVAFGPMAEKYGYQTEFYKPYANGKKILKIKGDYDIFGDGSLRLIATPGHSPGHQSLLIKLPKTGTILISGDVFITKKQRQNYGISAWGDKKSSIHSFVKVDNLLEREKAALWIPHDKEMFDSQKHTPEFYE